MRIQSVYSDQILDKNGMQIGEIRVDHDNGKFLNYSLNIFADPDTIDKNIVKQANDIFMQKVNQEMLNGAFSYLLNHPAVTLPADEVL